MLTYMPLIACRADWLMCRRSLFSESVSFMLWMSRIVPTTRLSRPSRRMGRLLTRCQR